jgi:FAD/FMN-containing dehydrogenase
MAMIQISEKQKFWGFIALGAIIIFFLVNAAVSDLASRSRKNANEVKLAEAQLKRSLRIQQASVKIAADYAHYASFFEMDKRLPLQVLEELLREIERISRDAAVSIVNLTPQNVPDTGRTREYKADLRIECQGTDRLLSFLNGVQTSKLLIKIVKFNMSAKDEQGSVLKAEMVLSLRTDPD